MALTGCRAHTQLCVSTQMLRPDVLAPGNTCPAAWLRCSAPPCAELMLCPRSPSGIWLTKRSVSPFLTSFFSLSRRLGAELGKSVVYQETNGGKRSPRCSQTCFGVILGLQTVRPVR